MNNEPLPTEEKEVEELSQEEINELQEQYYKQYIRMHTPWIKDETPRRNDACPCGSGKKYKNCCGQNIKSTYSNVEN